MSYRGIRNRRGRSASFRLAVCATSGCWPACLKFSAAPGVPAAWGWRSTDGMRGSQLPKSVVSRG